MIRAAPMTHQTPFRFQLALQGGGARIVALMAAMEAVQALEKEGKVKVTRVAGTSAGAIVGALFAAGVDLAQARKALIERVGPTVARDFPRPGWMRLVWQLLFRQRPLWDQKAVTMLLMPFFHDAGVNTLKQLYDKNKTHVRIVAADLSDGSKVTYSTDDREHKEKYVLPALLDSSAIPFCFRTWPNSISPVIVDGGICENLPSEDLADYEKDDGPTVAIGFETGWPGTPTTMHAFSLALLDTAMSNSIVRAKGRLGDRVHSIRTDLTTFAFDKASQFSEDTAYRIRTEARTFFDALIAQQAPQPAPTTEVVGDPWAESSIPTMERLWTIFTRQHDGQKARFEACSLVIHAHCLIDDRTDALFGAPDFVSYRTRFTPAQDAYCSVLSIIPSEGTLSLASSEITVRDRGGKPVDFVLLPARDPDSTRKRPVLLFYTPPLPAGSGPYTLDVRQRVPRFMQELTKEGKTEMFLQIKRAIGPVGHIDLVVHVPASLKTARMQAQHAGDPGRLMTPAELDAYPAPPGFRSVGWCGDQIPEDTRFGAEVVL